MDAVGASGMQLLAFCGVTVAARTVSTSGSSVQLLAFCGVTVAENNGTISGDGVQRCSVGAVSDIGAWAGFGAKTPHPLLSLPDFDLDRHHTVRVYGDIWESSA